MSSLSQPFAAAIPAQDEDLEARCVRAAEILDRADAVLITAGAGMSVESGIPAYRGPDGSYGSEVVDAGGRTAFQRAQAATWLDDPEGSRAYWREQLLRFAATTPSAAYALLRTYAESRSGGSFVATSNADGLFLRAGWGEEEIYECHGAYRRGQCASKCGAEAGFEVSPDALLCPSCGEPARAGVFMFDDYEFDAGVRVAQFERMRQWLRPRLSSRIAILEIGCGERVPAMRSLGEANAVGMEVPLIRVNPTDLDPGLERGRPIALVVELGAQEGLESILGSVLV